MPHLDAIMTITADGRLLVCPQDYNNDLPIGNILDEGATVKSLWERKEYKKFRELAIQKKCPPDLCIKRCMIYNPGYLFKIFMKNVIVHKSETLKSALKKIGKKYSWVMYCSRK